MCTPTALAVTSTEIVHAESAPITPSDNEIVSPPAGAERFPLHSLLTTGPLAMVTGPGTEGSTSVKAIPLTGDPEPFVTVKRMVEVLPGPITLGVKTFDNVG